MAKHTPGPWEIRRETRNEPTMPFGKFRDVKKLIVGSGSGNFDEPFRIVHTTYDNGEIDADTQLIALAPEMLDILEAFCNAFEGDDGLDEAMKFGIDADLVAARVIVAELNEVEAAK